MNLDANSSFPNAISQGSQICYSNQSQQQQDHHHHQQQQQQQQHHLVFSPSSCVEVPPVVAAAANNSSSSLLYCLSLLKDRVHQLQSLVMVLVAPDLGQHEPASSLAVATMGSLIQEIVGTATSMMLYCQQLNLGQPSPGMASTTTTAANNNSSNNINNSGLHWDAQQGLCHDTIDHLYAGNFNINAPAGKSSSVTKLRNFNQTGQLSLQGQPGSEGLSHIGNATMKNGKNNGKSDDSFEIIELDAADLLAKYTHYCQVCGKGFKRDANLRMHMRAHGDEYKNSAALSKPSRLENGNNNGDIDSKGLLGKMNNGVRKKYSCPQDGCRWNRNHPKFQPLKSMICVKNHYKRSHCPKLYVCKRCNMKRFSVLSDLRTHEKHCGDVKWRCTCGTTFSRKDKLMGHVSLFVGHTPLVDDVAADSVPGSRRSAPTVRTGDAYDRG